MALQLPQTLLSQVANFGQQPMQNLQQGLLTPVQIAAQQPAGVGALVSGLGGMFGVDTRSPQQLAQAEAAKLKEAQQRAALEASGQQASQAAFALKEAAALGAVGRDLIKKRDLGLISDAQLVNQVEQIKRAEANAARTQQKESLEVMLQEAVSTNASTQTIRELEKQVLAMGGTAEQIRSAKAAGVSARNASETALASSLRQQLIAAVDEGDVEGVGRVIKTAQEKLPTFEVQKELQAARKLKADRAQLTTDENNTAFNQNLYDTLSAQIGENAAEAYKLKPNNAKAYESLQEQADLIAKEGEDAKAIIKDNTVFRDVLNSNIRSALGTETFSEEEIKKIETAVADGFDGLYSTAKNTMTVAEVNEIIGTVLSDPEIAAAIKEGKTKIDRPGPFTGDDSLSSRINTTLRAITGNVEDPRLQEAKAKLEALKAKQKQGS
jgi:hypothetical protein